MRVSYRLSIAGQGQWQGNKNGDTASSVFGLVCWLASTEISIYIDLYPVPTVTEEGGGRT